MAYQSLRFKSKDSKEAVDALILKATYQNARFPSRASGMGTGVGPSIQTIVHDMGVKELGDYIDGLNAHNPKVGIIDTLRGVNKKVISGTSITYDDFIAGLILILEAKMTAHETKEKQAKLEALKTELAGLQTPQERKKELQKQIQALESNVE